MAAVHDAMEPISVQGKPLDDHDLRLLLNTKLSRDSDEEKGANVPVCLCLCLRCTDA